MLTVTISKNYCWQKFAWYSVSNATEIVFFQRQDAANPSFGPAYREDRIAPRALARVLTGAVCGLTVYALFQKDT